MLALTDLDRYILLGTRYFSLSTSAKGGCKNLFAAYYMRQSKEKKQMYKNDKQQWGPAFLCAAVTLSLGGIKFVHEGITILGVTCIIGAAWFSILAWKAQ
jgi:hypothetical protein